MGIASQRTLSRSLSLSRSLNVSLTFSSQKGHNRKYNLRTFTEGLVIDQGYAMRFNTKKERIPKWLSFLDHSTCLYLGLINWSQSGLLAEELFFFCTKKGSLVSFLLVVYADVQGRVK